MGWLAALGSLFSAIASALGLANKMADASKTSADQATGVTAQVAADEKKSLAVESAELAASVSSPAAPSTLDAMKAGKF